MPTATGWRVVSFSAEHASGTIENSSTGERAAFPLEAWWPCEPYAARILQESVQPRHLLFPQPREAVEVAWRVSRSGKTVPARVVRVEPVVRTTPPLPFLVWFGRIQHHVPELADWDDGEWACLFHEFDGLEDDVRSTAPASALRHVAVLGWIAGHTPSDIGQRTLRWVTPEESPGLVAAVAMNDDGRVFLDLPTAVVNRLVDEGLILLLP